jgi:hypothetical protein
MSGPAKIGSPDGVRGKAARKGEQLRGEQDRLIKRTRSLRAQLQKIDERQSQIRRELHRLDIEALVNVEGGVQLGCRYPRAHQLAGLNDVKGTVLEVRRTRATVAFGAEKWDMLLDSLKTATAQQGMAFTWDGVSVESFRGPDPKE